MIILRELRDMAILTEWRDGNIEGMELHGYNDGME